MSYSSLPKVLAEIAEVAGLEAAIALLQNRGGRKIYIPAQLTEDHWLIELCGRQAAEKLCSNFGASQMIIPVGTHGAHGRLRGRLDEMIAARATATQISSELGYSKRAIEKRRNQLRKDRGQGSLF